LYVKDRRTNSESKSQLFPNIFAIIFGCMSKIPAVRRDKLRTNSESKSQRDSPCVVPKAAVCQRFPPCGGINSEQILKANNASLAPTYNNQPPIIDRRLTIPHLVKGLIHLDHFFINGSVAGQTMNEAGACCQLFFIHSRG
jgi:hypothetical protein